MDGAILVVAGTDGTMPQTKEHLLLANLVKFTFLSIPFLLKTPSNTHTHTHTHTKHAHTHRLE